MSDRIRRPARPHPSLWHNAPAPAGLRACTAVRDGVRCEGQILPGAECPVCAFRRAMEEDPGPRTFEEVRAECTARTLENMRRNARK